MDSWVQFSMRRELLVQNSNPGEYLTCLLNSRDTSATAGKNQIIGDDVRAAHHIQLCSCHNEFSLILMEMECQWRVLSKWIIYTLSIKVIILASVSSEGKKH